MKETPEQRSRTMRAVKSVDTTPEMAVRRLVHAMGYRFRLHRSDLPGKPDLVLPRLRRVIFVHGCFWHGHDCARGARIPKANRDYWQSKIGRNVTRDAAHLTALQAAGWRAAVIWECELRQPGLVRRRLAVFLRVRAGAQRGRPS
ncbi:MAG TPA: very short patch repair endonuclease [Bryobacteraceae bacterium]|nr:very short patch repair endonuclease [Bryobacteraceae bacterium]